MNRVLFKGLAKECARFQTIITVNLSKEYTVYAASFKHWIYYNLKTGSDLTKSKDEESIH